MRVWILEPKEGAEKLWIGYDPRDRIAVVAPNHGKARKIAGKAQPVQSRQKDPGRRDLDEPNFTPWRNPDASACREISDESDACVLAIQRPDEPIKDPQVMA